MKKLVSITMSFILICCMLSGCAGTIGNSSSKINIVCTIYPQYDWVMNLLGNNTDDYNVTLLVSNGTDLHSYQPSAKDIVTIKSCDLLIYVGGASDSWVHELIDESANEDMVVINMLDTLGGMAKAEEVVEGMEGDHGHDHAHEHTEDCDDQSHHESADDNHEEDAHINSETDVQNENIHNDYETKNHTRDITEYDEHIWLSLHNAKVICERITSVLCELDSKKTDIYASALSTYSQSLDSLDKQYSDAVASATRTTLLFGDRFPFRYLTDDYKIDYYAAFAGCSADTEASFQTIVFLADKLDSLSLPGVCVTESTDKSLAETIIENTTLKNHKIYVFDSMQSITSKDIEEGATYLSIMEANLKVLTEALN